MPPQFRPASPATVDPRGDFDRLLRPLIPVFFRHAYRWTAARDQAEDLVQELLVRLYPRLEELAALDQVQPWALRVMYRIFVDQHRRNRNAPVRPMHEADAAAGGAPGESADDYPDLGLQPPDLVELELTRARLSAALLALNDEQRTVVAMHDIEGYRLEEISRVTGVPIGTLKSRLHRARGRLRELLGPEEPFADRVRVAEQGAKS